MSEAKKRFLRQAQDLDRRRHCRGGRDPRGVVRRRFPARRQGHGGHDRARRSGIRADQPTADDVKLARPAVSAIARRTAQQAMRGQRSGDAARRNAQPQRRRRPSTVAQPTAGTRRRDRTTAATPNGAPQRPTQRPHRNGDANGDRNDARQTADATTVDATTAATTDGRIDRTARQRRPQRRRPAPNDGAPTTARSGLDAERQRQRRPQRQRPRNDGAIDAGNGRRQPQRPSTADGNAGRTARSVNGRSQRQTTANGRIDASNRQRHPSRQHLTRHAARQQRPPASCRRFAFGRRPRMLARVVTPWGGIACATASCACCWR